MAVKTTIQNEKRKSKKRSSKKGSRSRHGYKSRLWLRYLMVFKEICKKNKLKVILFGLIVTALTLTIHSMSSNGQNVSSDSSYYDDYNKEAMFNQRVKLSGDDDDESDSSSGKNNDIDFVIVDQGSDEVSGLQGSIDDSNNDNNNNNNNNNDNRLNSESEDYLTLDDIEKKVQANVDKIKEDWSKSDFAKNFPDSKFEDTIIGATAESFGRNLLKPKAALVMYISESTIDDVVKSIKSIQDMFNSWTQYPWVLISGNGEEFNDPMWMDGLKASDLFSDVDDTTKILLKVASKNYWEIPDWIDYGRFAKSRHHMRLAPNGDSIEHRLWVRYFTQFLSQETFMNQYDWMWSMKPGTTLDCDIDYDMFRLMQDESKLLGITGAEKPDGLSTGEVWNFFGKIKKEYKDLIMKDNFSELLIKKKNDKDKKKDDEFEECSFLVEEFGLVNLNFLRSKPYQRLMEHIDRDGYIFYNGWTINTVQTLSIIFFTNKNSIKLFDHIGFASNTLNKCPIHDDIFKDYKCKCDQGLDYTFTSKACSNRVYEILKMKLPDAWDRHKDILK